MIGANFKKIETSAKEDDAEMYNNLLCYPNSVNRYYWLASRWTRADGTITSVSTIIFGLHISGISKIYNADLFASHYGNAGAPSHSLRPIVSVQFTDIDRSVGDGLSADTAFGMN